MLREILNTAAMFGYQMVVWWIEKYLLYSIPVDSRTRKVPVLFPGDNNILSESFLSKLNHQLSKENYIRMLVDWLSNWHSYGQGMEECVLLST